MTWHRYYNHWHVLRLSSLSLHSNPLQDFLVWQAPKQVHQFYFASPWLGMHHPSAWSCRTFESTRRRCLNIRMIIFSHSRWSCFPGNCLCMSSFVSGILLILKTITSIFRSSRVTRLITRATSCPRGVSQLSKIQHHAHPTCECYLFTQCYRQMNVVTWSKPA